jgi:hypothetical protein
MSSNSSMTYFRECSTVKSHAIKVSDMLPHELLECRREVPVTKHHMKEKRNTEPSFLNHSTR